MHVLRQMRHSQFFRLNTVFFTGSVAVGALNYLYYPIIGRMLAPGSFGEVQTLVSLFLQLSIFLIVLSQVVVNIVANYPDPTARNEFVFEFEKLALLGSVVLLGASIVLRSRLQSLLHFTSAWPFMLLGAAVVAAVPFTLRSAFLRGQQRFGLVAVANCIVAGGKLVFSVGLVAIGFGTAGAMGGVLAAQIVACICVAFWAMKLGLARTPGKHPVLPDMRLLLPELGYGAVVLIASLAITLQYSVDIVVIKHYFSADVAGQYAGIAAVARILFFLTMSIAQVLISSVRLKQSPTHNRQLLIKSLAMLCGLSLPVLAVIALRPTLVVRVLMGPSYAAMAPILPRLSLAIFIVAILNLLVAYQLALRKFSVAITTALGFIVSCALILWHHGSPTAVVNGLLTGSAAMLGLFGVWTLIERKRMA